MALETSSCPQEPQKPVLSLLPWSMSGLLSIVWGGAQEDSWRVSVFFSNFVFKNEGTSKWDFHSLHISRMCSLAVSKKSTISRLFCLRWNVWWCGSLQGADVQNDHLWGYYSSPWSGRSAGPSAFLPHVMDVPEHGVMTNIYASTIQVESWLLLMG